MKTATSEACRVSGAKPSQRNTTNPTRTTQIGGWFMTAFFCPASVRAERGFATTFATGPE